MPSPNNEQLKAIEHNGGVLLKAGAGSGKTYVLKEHMIYVVKNWIKEFKNNPHQDLSFEELVKSRFRKIILMTFTKKAAGELAIRIESAFNESLAENPEDEIYWKAVVHNTAYLQISTIHGFCFYLIKMGFFPNISADDEILTDSEFQSILLEILDKFLNIKLTQNSQNELINILIKDKTYVFEALKSIFGDPSLRLAWKDWNNNKQTEDIDDIVATVLSLKGFKLTRLYEFELSFYSQHSTKNWFKFAEKFISETRNTKPGLKGLVSLYNYFKLIDFKIPTKPSRGVEPEVVRFYEQIRDLKDFLKKEGEDFYQYLENHSEHLQDWLALIHELIGYIEIEYSRKPGLTFSDLEYIVYNELSQDFASATRISEEFQYLIVDEFQDTSFIQYEILKKICQEDYSKLFCVGDLKQAIYGFRGGELGVFLDCQEKIPQNLSLQNNYRSDQSVITFNNAFFDFLFKKGDKYEGEDALAVAVEPQRFPEDKNTLGEVYKIQTTCDFLDEAEKISTSQVDYIEAIALFKQIQSIPNEEIAVLYKKLRPSHYLIHLLMQANIGFTAQIKIPFIEDPIIGIFKVLIEFEFNKNEHAKEYQKAIIHEYLNILAGSLQTLNLTEMLDQYRIHLKYYGLYQAFLNFLDHCHVSCSLYQQNLNNLEMLVKSNFSDREKIILALNNQENVSYSFDFCFGRNSNRIKIMTAHASKGLQFKHVLLGGVYTNESTLRQRSLLGKVPMSFQWTLGIDAKKRFKTPQYILEGLIDREKDISENKRLFYVANTRAVSTLGWVEIDFGNVKRTRSQANAWSRGFEVYFSERNSNISAKNVDIKNDYDEQYLITSENDIPFFHLNPLGNEVLAQKSKRFLMSELSVTRLTSLVECPRKFYFQNICKFTSEEMDLLDQKIQNPIFYESEELSSYDFSNAAKRGSEIHELLSEIIIEKNPEHPSLVLDDHKDLSWTVDKLKNYFENSQLVSEKPIKFELFGYMISGIPDLVIYPEDPAAPIEVWDFKTGKYTDKKLPPYMFQLYCYAYAQYILGNCTDERPIEMVICFVDDKQIVKQNTLKTDVEKYLSETFNSINTPHVKNLEKCEWCSFSRICEK